MCAIKVDSRKTNDSINQSFIVMFLLAVGCPPKFVNQVRVFIASVMYSIAFNASSKWYFKDCQGIREGDPVSPFLFVLVVSTKLCYLKLLQARSLNFTQVVQAKKVLVYALQMVYYYQQQLTFPFCSYFKKLQRNSKNLSRLSVNHSNSHSSRKSKLYSPTLMVQNFLCFHYCP